MAIRSRYNNDKQSRLLRRTAKEIKSYVVQRRVFLTLLAMLLSLTTLLYIIATLYKQSGSFTVSINKYDMSKYGLSLSETKDMANKSSHINANIKKHMTNIAAEWLPENINSIDGEHNGDDYLAYTFYLENAGAVDVSYQYAIYISDITHDLDEAIRVRLYMGDEFETYAKTRSDGLGAELDSKEFYSSNVVCQDRVDNFKSGDIQKFTVVVWIEGNDPDCVDWLIGGELKLEMMMQIVH
jgi:hypothetical protein